MGVYDESALPYIPIFSVFTDFSDLFSKNTEKIGINGRSAVGIKMYLNVFLMQVLQLYFSGICLYYMYKNKLYKQTTKYITLLESEKEMSFIWI